MNPSPSGKPDWIWPLGLCLAAFALRAGLYLAWPGVVHPDETFQYIEQGHRLLGHPGLVPWEFAVGVRSWALPALVACLLWLGGLFDLDPVGRVQAVSLAFAAWSTVGVWVAYRWANRLGGPAAAIAAAGLSIASIEMAHFSAHPLNETLATPLLMAGLYLIRRGPASRRADSLAAGALLAASVYLRVQLGPAAAIGVLWLTWGERRRRLVPLAAAALATLLAGGVLDWLTLGAPFQSVWLYVHLNISQGVAAHFGVAPWYRYIDWLHLTWEPLFVPILLLAALGAWRAPVLLAVAAALALPLFAIGHKELRFLYPAMPFGAMLVAIGGVHGARVVLRWRRVRVPPRALGAAIAMTGLAAALVLAVQPPSRNRWSVGTATGAVMRQINADPDACGVAIHPTPMWSAAAGYAYLRPGIVLYTVDPAAGKGQLAAFNYIYAMAELDGRRAGYARLACWSTARLGGCLWRRAGGCQADAAATGARPLILPTGIPGRDPGE